MIGFPIKTPLIVFLHSMLNIFFMNENDQIKDIFIEKKNCFCNASHECKIVTSFVKEGFCTQTIQLMVV